MHSRLLEIIEEKKREVVQLKKKGIPSPGKRVIPGIRDFKSAISKPDRINLIAEIKFASPSAGVIREKIDPAEIGRTYEQGGAAALSILTDQKFFGGHVEYLPVVKQAVGLPILRKDFIIDEIQIREALTWGADAVLLIVRILSGGQLKEFLQSCQEKGLAALVEVHDRDDLEKALESKAEIIGINNRDLDTFKINLQTTQELSAAIPPGRIIIGESGIHTKKDVESLKGTGVAAVLVGSYLMGSNDIKSKTREIVEAGR
ncbi:MAG: indole-3-glycerol phosphate synthase TrpC [Thermodesulfobacteriota bacterium]